MPEVACPVCGIAVTVKEDREGDIRQWLAERCPRRPREERGHEA